MGRPERPGRNERLLAGEKSGDAVDLGRIDRFLQRHRWDHRWHALREHRLAGTGRSDHEHVVPSGHGHFERALHVRLAFYVAEIGVVSLMMREKFREIATRRG